MFGFTANEFAYIVNKVVVPIEAQNGRVFCFGSRARGEHQQFSDLDLLVRGDESLKPKIFEIMETLENENFPYKVDIVLESELADSYRESVIKDLKLFKN